MADLSQQEIKGDVTGGSGPLRYKGRVLVHGSVLSGAQLHADGDIIIRGRIEDSHVQSTGGGVYADQGIIGEDTVVRAFGDVKAPLIRGANVDCFGSLYVRDIIFQADVRAKNIVEMKKGGGIIEASRVAAGMEISVRSIGSREVDPDNRTVITLENSRQKELFEISLIFEQKLRQKSGRITELQKVIEVIRIIGDKVATLSSEKRQELALKVKEYNDLRQQITEIMKEKERVLMERDRTNKVLRSIVATSEVYPGVEVKIDNAGVTVNKLYKNVIFYKSGIVIIGDLDAFMKRKRLMD